MTAISEEEEFEFRRRAEAERASTTKPKPKPKRNWQGEVTGFMANVNRGLGIGDELAAAGNTVANVFSGKVPLSGVGDDYNRSMAEQRRIEDSYAADRPNAAALARGTGMAATAAVPAGNTANLFAQGGRAVNAARGATLAATQGATYAAVDRGSARERLAASSRAARDPLTLTLGAVSGGLATPRGAPKQKPATAPTSGEVLADIGVSSSIPQRMGRTAKGVEDLGKRAPILGPAMVGYQDRQLGQLNRGIGLKALEPVGLSIPKEIKPGFEMVEYVDKKLGGVYDQAADMVPMVRLDEDLVNDAAAIGARKVDLSESEQRLWDSAVKDRLTRLSSGEASGAMIKKIQSELRALRGEQAKKGNDTLAAMFGDLERAIMGVVGRANPEARALIAKADEGWQVYSMMNDAARAATANGGVFLPGQLNTQVRRSADRMGSNMAGKGKGPLQDIATAASEIIPDSYGNPGTANAVGLGAGGVGLFTNPGATLTGAAVLSGAATPYFLAGRKIIETLPDTASRAQLAKAARDLAELAASDPRVGDLQRMVAARLSRAAGVAGGSQAGQSPNLFAQP
jgi:hypothetical protein